METASPDHESALADLVSLWQQRRADGKAATLAELCRERPELLPELERRIALLEQISALNDSLQTIDEPERKPTPPLSAESRPQLIGRFAVERILGEGGFGRVYLAHDNQLQRLVAIKVPHRHLVSRREDAEAYLTEARIVARLDHPNIVTVYDIGDSEEFPFFIVSKYIDGTNLAEKIKRSRLSILEASELVATVAEALHYAHKQGLVHRDIKPGNVLLDQDSKPFLADFGLALREKDVGTGPRYAGTPPYMSPEQARGEGHRVDGRSDIFSLGVILYELLVGRRPFQADSPMELLERIATLDARPPRQWDDALPKELERICLKALSKRAADRYTTAKDLADDLRHFLAQPSQQEKLPTASGIPADAISAAPPTPSATPGSGPSELQGVAVVPRGLRSFDAIDADFFVSLLPGPRDREGLPESLRFWKARIEETDAEQTFPVGLLYGPSGCGKSSLFKAGLLPRLSPAVTPVYVEATARETEIRILKGLRKHCPGLPADAGLAASVAALRRGIGLEPGEKVLLVLDQFEQWLHAWRDQENTELVQALRHCEGGRVQCVILVRDDFWMATTRFLRELEIRLVEGENAAAVDLFDPRHAKKVLTLFGRALGALPERTGELTTEQTSFLDQAVQGLAQDGKVIPVRLVVFAEMVKGREWTPATLKALGGMEGIGVTFLEETFSSATAAPGRRLHQVAARAVLRALLPEQGTDIRGTMRPRQELLEASGYADRPDDFNELMRMLDRDLRLVSPSDPEGVDSESAQERIATAREFYQLTHDYLVPAVREWLTRKQKETLRGRLMLSLAEQATVWNRRPDNRYLPSGWEWARIRLLTRSRSWTPPQRKMMRRATRYYLVRGLIAATVLLLVGLGGWVGYARLQAQHLRTRLFEARPADVPGIIKEMDAYRRWVDPLLREAYAHAEREDDPGRQLRASLALLSSDHGQAPYLYKRMLVADPQDLEIIRGELEPYKDEYVQPLWSELANGQSQARRLRAAGALAAYAPDDPQWTMFGTFLVQSLVGGNAWPLDSWKKILEPKRDLMLSSLADAVADNSWGQAQRRTITDLYRGFCEGREDAYSPLEQKLSAANAPTGPGIDGIEEAKRKANVAASLVALDRADIVRPLLIHSKDPTVRSYLIENLASAGVGPQVLQSRLEKESDVSARRALVLALGGFPADKVKSLEPILMDLYENAPDAGLHAAAGWVIRDWKHEEKLTPIDRRLATGKVEGRRGWYVNKQGQTFVVLRKPHPLEGESGNHPLAFAIASTEVTVAQFLQFKRDHKIDEKTVPTLDCPVNMVSWYDAAAYCNWLSEKEGIPRDQWCYVSKGDKWEVVPDYWKLTGYRLTTEVEWEYACRAGAETQWCCGEGDVELIGHYARYFGNAQDKGVNRAFPVATLKPNDFGLFDTHGNLSEWCQDISKDHADDPIWAGLTQANRPLRAVARGGTFTNPFKSVRTNSWGPHFRFNELRYTGFRPVRSLKQISDNSSHETSGR